MRLLLLPLRELLPPAAEDNEDDATEGDSSDESSSSERSPSLLEKSVPVAWEPSDEEILFLRPLESRPFRFPVCLFLLFFFLASLAPDNDDDDELVTPVSDLSSFFGTLTASRRAF